MNNDKRFVGTFQTETEVIAKVQELKATGISDDNIYVITKDDTDLHVLRSRTDAEVKSTEGSWMDKFMNFLSGEDHIHNLLNGTGLSEADKDRYTREINNGAILLYVDEGEVDTYRRDNNAGYSSVDTPNAANLQKDTYTEPLGTTDSVRSEGKFNRSIEEVPETMKVHEERLSVDKQQVKKGEVTVDKNVVEDRKTVDIPVEHEEITIERRPVHGEFNQSAEEDFRTTDAFGDETIRVPVTEEKVEVTKKPVVTEEIVINKKRVTGTEHVDETVKREEVEVNRNGETNDVTFKGNLSDTDRNRRTDKF